MLQKKYLELFENIKLNHNKKYSNIAIFQFSKDITFSTQIHRIIFIKYFGSGSDYSEEMRKKHIIQYNIDIELYTTPFYPNLKIYFKHYEDKNKILY